jgi:hypothetical protein
VPVGESEPTMYAVHRVACLLIISAMLGAFVASGSSAGVPIPAGTFAGCPHGIIPLGGASATYELVAPRVVLRFVRTAVAARSKTPSKLIGARATSTFLVRDWLPSGWIRSECGETVWRDSVGVTVYFPAMDLPHNPVGHCNACDHIIYLIARTAHSWTVWGNY